MATTEQMYTQEEVDTLLTRCKKDIVLWLYSRQLTFGTGVYQYCIEWLNEDMPKLEEIREKYDRKFLKSEGVENHEEVFATYNTYQRKHTILEPLASLLEIPVGSRPDLMKGFVRYCKENKMWNSTTRSFILNETLRTILKIQEDTVNIFSIQKYLNVFVGEEIPIKLDTFDLWSDDETCSSCSE